MGEVMRCPRCHAPGDCIEYDPDEDAYWMICVLGHQYTVVDDNETWK